MDGAALLARMCGMKPQFFLTAQDFRAWLAAHHAGETELWLGYYKKKSGKPSITYKEAVDEALCFGWIDGVGQAIDDEKYMQRFTPRKKTSTWSLINVANVKRLTKEGRMQPAGIAAFKARSEKRTGTYSAENKEKSILTPAMEKEFRKNAKAWENFQAMAPSYKRTAIWTVISAKQEATRQKRLKELIVWSAKNTTIKQLTRASARKPKAPKAKGAK
jgi:uncharacterized protein YdeI (YjbR/CyaY-like superfamily)